MRTTPGVAVLYAMVILVLLTFVCSQAPIPTEPTPIETATPTATVVIETATPTSTAIEVSSVLPSKTPIQPIMIYIVTPTSSPPKVIEAPVHEIVIVVVATPEPIPTVVLPSLLPRAGG